MSGIDGTDGPDVLECSAKLAQLANDRRQVIDEIEAMTASRSEVVLFGTEVELDIHYACSARLDARLRHIRLQIKVAEAQRSEAATNATDYVGQFHVLGVPYAHPLQAT